MNKIKDFIYDKSDIVIALLILVIATAVILWRMDVILKYPKTISISQNQNHVEIGGSDDSENTDDGADENGDTSGDDSNSVQNKQSQDKPKSDKKTDSSHKPQGENTTNTPGNNTNNQDGGIWSGNVLAKDVAVNVQGNTATQAIQCLIDAGLFKDYNEYQKICEKKGLDHEKVKAGYLTFDKGSTKGDIARAMNWG